MSEVAAAPLALPHEWVEALAQRVAEILDERAERRRWTDLHGVAEYLGWSDRRARYLRERGLPAKKIGKRLLFDLREVDAWLEHEGWT
jgi:hypothetical protein